MKGDTIHTISREDGAFEATLSMRKFKLEISISGYISYKDIFTIADGSTSIQLKSIRLKPNYQELDPVTILRVKPLTIGTDTITFNAGAYTVRAGAQLESLLKRLPGLEVDIDGGLIIQGKKIGKVMVDGKSFFGGDVLMAMRNLPVDIIDKIQIIDDYGERARLTGVKSGQSEKVLNLVLKKDKRNGWFGHIQAGAGNQGKYKTEGFGNSFKGERQIGLITTLDNSVPIGNLYKKTAGISYADHWTPIWKVESNTFLSTEAPGYSSIEIINNYYGNVRLHQTQASILSGKIDNSGINASLIYTPDAYHTIRLSPLANIQTNCQSAGNRFTTSQEDTGFVKTAEGNSLFRSNAKTSSTGASIDYQQSSTNNKGKLGSSVTFQTISNLQDNDNFLNSNITIGPQVTKDINHYLINSKNTGYSFGGQVNYFIALGKSGILEMGYNISYNTSHNDKLTWQADSLLIHPILIDSLSQHYTFNSMNQKIHGGYSVKINKLNLTTGIDGQPGSLSGDMSGKGTFKRYSYFNWLPGLQGSYELSPNQTLSLQYSGTPQLPTFQQVQPISDYSNPQYPIEGNPNLQPGFTHNINVHYEQASIKPLHFFGFGLSVGYNATSNAILSKIIYPKDSTPVLQKTTFVNINGQHAYFMNYHVTLPGWFHNVLRVNLNGQFSTARSFTFVNDISQSIKSLSGTQSIHLQWMVPDVIESDWSGNYTFNHTQFPGGSSLSVTAVAAGWIWKNNFYFLKHGVLTTQCSQTGARTQGANWHFYPILATASVEWQFLKNNSGNLSLTSYDLLNKAVGITQSIGPTGTVSSQTSMAGRYFIFSFEWKWGKFSK